MAYLSIVEAIEEVSIRHPDYKEVKISHKSLAYFLRILGHYRARYLCKWAKDRKSLVYNNYGLKLKLILEDTFSETAVFVNKKLPSIEVKLSG
jgi:hypothetical protein